MSLLELNQLLEFTDQDQTERVLWVHPEGNGYYLIDVRDVSAFPLFRSKKEIVDLFEQKKIRVTKDDRWLAPLSDATVDPKHKTKRDANWQIIGRIVADEPAIFDSQKRGQAVAQIVSKKTLTKQTIYRLLRRYWQRGKIPNALLPDFDKCGGRGKGRAITDKERGRPPLDGVYSIKVDDDVRRIIIEVGTRYYAKNDKLTLSGAYEEMIGSHFSKKVVDESTGELKNVPKEPYPSLRQFEYWFQKENDILAIERMRRTPRVYDKEIRALLDTSTNEVPGPAARYQIDATIADVYLVSRLDRSKIVGRPVLYIVIDVFSRMIVGIYVGFEGPSWIGAMMALANCAADKVAFCARFGINIRSEDWPCQSLPEFLLGDRGELASPSPDMLVNNFNVTVQNTAPYRADWKGVVEQRFKLLPAKFKAYVPGYVGGDFRARGGTDYRLDATLDIDQFTRIIIRCLLYYNNHHSLEGYDKSAAMLADEVSAIPIEMWDWGVARRSGKLRTFPEQQVQMSLLPTDTGRVTHLGIHFYGCYYTCQKAISERWFEKAKMRGTWKVSLSYEPRLMDDIYFHEDGGGGRIQFLSCSLAPRSQAYRGLSLWEVDQMNQAQRALHKKDDRRALGPRLDLAEQVKDVVAEAQAMQSDHQGSDRERTRNIKSNRREERLENQRQEAFRPGGGHDLQDGKEATVVPFVPGRPPVEDDHGLPNIADLRRRLEQDGDDGQE